jgi:hypothetical protein
MVYKGFKFHLLGFGNCNDSKTLNTSKKLGFYAVITLQNAKKQFKVEDRFQLDAVRITFHVDIQACLKKIKIGLGLLREQNLAFRSRQTLFWRLTKSYRGL